MYLLIFEFLGTNELLVVLVVALILLGPRKLPQMSRKIGKSLAEFKRTSEEFKRTWEKEVNLESLAQDSEPVRTMLPQQDTILNSTIGRENIEGTLPMTVATNVDSVELVGNVPPPTVTPADPANMRPRPEETSNEPVPATPTRKRDWL